MTKVARRALRVSDLFHRERFAAKLGEFLDYHDFILQRYFQAPAIDFQQVLKSNLQLGERLQPLVADVTGILETLSVVGGNVLFEGAQGAILDVPTVRDFFDHHHRRRRGRRHRFGSAPAARGARHRQRAKSRPCMKICRDGKRARSGLHATII